MRALNVPRTRRIERNGVVDSTGLTAKAVTSCKTLKDPPPVLVRSTSNGYHGFSKYPQTSTTIGAAHLATWKR